MFVLHVIFDELSECEPLVRSEVKWCKLVLRILVLVYAWDDCFCMENVRIECHRLLGMFYFVCVGDGWYL
jgi:hypothetical protein